MKSNVPDLVNIWDTDIKFMQKKTNPTDRLS